MTEATIVVWPDNNASKPHISDDGYQVNTIITSSCLCGINGTLVAHSKSDILYAKKIKDLKDDKEKNQDLIKTLNKDICNLEETHNIDLTTLAAYKSYIENLQKVVEIV